MPGGRSRSRKKNKGQDTNVSFRFHSGGSLESGLYLSEENRESPAFSDSLDELEESEYVSKQQIDNENASRGGGSSDVGNQQLVRELLESAIDDTNTEAKHFDHPPSDPLFQFDQEPLIHQELDKNDTPEKDSFIHISPGIELQYKETLATNEQQLADSEGFTEHGDMMDIKEKESYSKPIGEVHRLLDSEDEELFLSLSKEKASSTNQTSDDIETTETDYVPVKTPELESDNDSIPVTVSPLKDGVLVSDPEDMAIFAEVDTHPLIRTASVGDDGETNIKDSLRRDDSQLLLSEEHFSKIPPVSEPNQGSKSKPKRPPPPRPPPPSKLVKSVSDSAKFNSLPSKQHSQDDNIIVKPEPFQDTKSILSAAVDDEDKGVQLEGSVDEHSIQTSSDIVRDDSLSFSNFMIYTLVVFLYYSLNPSSYLAGFLTGFLFFFVTSAVIFICYVNYLLSIQQQEREAVQKSQELSSQQFIDQLDDQLYYKVCMVYFVPLNNV